MSGPRHDGARVTERGITERPGAGCRSWGSEMPELKGQLAIVTGASSGLGEATAVRLRSWGRGWVAGPERGGPGPRSRAHQRCRWCRLDPSGRSRGSGCRRGRHRPAGLQQRAAAGAGQRRSDGCTRPGGGVGGGGLATGHHREPDHAVLAQPGRFSAHAGRGRRRHHRQRLLRRRRTAPASSASPRSPRLWPPRVYRTTSAWCVSTPVPWLRTGAHGIRPTGTSEGAARPHAWGRRGHPIRKETCGLWPSPRTGRLYCLVSP